MTPTFRFELLSPAHDRASFACGDEALDRYFRVQVTQDVRRHVTNCFVAVETASGLLVAYYTISSASIATLDLPPEEIKRLPRYPVMPAVRIGRLAVDRRFRGRGFGVACLLDAANRALRAEAAAFALLVDAANDSAIAFYQHHGFRPLASKPQTLFLPLVTAARTLLDPPRH